MERGTKGRGDDLKIKIGTARDDAFLSETQSEGIIICERGLVGVLSVIINME